nr:MAG TPA: hypothetical protein [Caudoviricetes sp.]DAQ84534.1 MAG TPA: hypothetical protein [Caudoviricetes sp.]
MLEETGIISMLFTALIYFSTNMLITNYIKIW